MSPPKKRFELRDNLRAKDAALDAVIAWEDFLVAKEETHDLRGNTSLWKEQEFWTMIQRLDEYRAALIKAKLRYDQTEIADRRRRWGR